MILQNRLNFIFDEINKAKIEELESQLKELSFIVQQNIISAEIAKAAFKNLSLSANEAINIAADTTNSNQPLEIFDTNCEEDLGYINFVEEN